jgi:hypothetical protein
MAGNPDIGLADGLTADESAPLPILHKFGERA